jgi:hypothetical protein
MRVSVAKGMYICRLQKEHVHTTCASCRYRVVQQQQRCSVAGVGCFSVDRKYTQSEIGDLIDWVEKDFHPSV